MIRIKSRTLSFWMMTVIPLAQTGFATPCMAQRQGGLTVAVPIGDIKTAVTVLGNRLAWYVNGIRSEFELPFDTVLCGAPFFDDVIIGGRDNEENFVLVRVALAEGVVRVTEQRLYRRNAFAALCHDRLNHDLFLIAKPSGQIVCASGDRLPAEGDWEQVKTVPGGWNNAWIHKDGGLRVGTVRMYQRILRAKNGTWETTVHKGENGLGGDSVRVTLVRPLTTTGPIEASVGAIGKLLLEDESGEALFLGIAKVGRGVYRLPAGVHLDPAKLYRLKYEGADKAGTGRWAAATICIAQRVAMSPGLELRAFGPTNPLECYSGSSFFMASGKVLSSTISSNLTIYSWSRITSLSEPAPVRLTKSLPTLLFASVGVALPLKTEAGKEAVFCVPFTIPQDPSLAGSVLYFQACLVDVNTNAAVLSEVHGVVVRSGPAGAVYGDPATLAAYLTKYRVAENEIGSVLSRFGPQ